MCQLEVVSDQLWSTLDSPRAIQTSIWANTDNLSINQNHPRHLWPNFKKSKIFIFFEIGQVTVTPRGSIGNFICWPNWLKRSDTIWIRLFEPKDGIIKCQRWKCWTVGPDLFLSLYRVEANGLLAGRWQMCCPRSTLINNRQPQSHSNINLGQYKQLFYQPKPSQTPLTEVQKIQNFDFFWNRTSDCDPPRLNWQHQHRPMRLKPWDTIWI